MSAPVYTSGGNSAFHNFANDYVSASSPLP
jgi:hypothetical protein